MAEHQVLIVPGLHGSGPDHWQTRWEEARVDCERIEQESWDDPDPLGWLMRIDRAVAKTGKPIVFVAHSLGCLAVAAWSIMARLNPRRPMAALLVAPCDPVQIGANEAIRRFALAAHSRIPLPSTLVASANDPYASFSRSCTLAREWGSDLIDAGELGHINAKSGIDSWRRGQRLLDRTIASILPNAMTQRIAAPAHRTAVMPSQQQPFILH